MNGPAGSRDRIELRAGLLAVRLLVSLVVSLVLAGFLIAPEVARSEVGASSPTLFRCETRHASLREFARSDGSINFYHGLGWLAGGGTLSLATETSRHWSHENGFDTGIQSGFRLNSVDARRDAASASDFLVVLTAGVLPAAAITTEFVRTHDCVETWDMFGDAFESVSLAIFVSEAIKVASGRQRPYGGRCGDPLAWDADCRGDDRNRSFPSGHATLAAAGAGLSCRFALEREAFGPSATARIAPCALGVAGAFTAGMLRLSSDNHWASDVLVGFGVGAFVGYFDTWGPLEWLRLEKRDASGKLEASGRVLPFAAEGRVGAQWTMIY